MTKFFIITVIVASAVTSMEAFARAGIVKEWNEAKGFVFIKEDKTGKEYFADVNGLIDHVVEKDRVTFDTQVGKKGTTNAINVRLEQKAAPSASATPIPTAPK